MDLYSRRIIGWSMKPTLAKEIVLDALLMAVWRRKPKHDNAVVESFFSSLKKEKIRRHIFKTREAARAELFDYIEVFYNRGRHHQHLGNISPTAYEQQMAN